MEQLKHPNLLWGSGSACATVASTFADRFIGEAGAGCLFVLGVAGMLFFTIRAAWEHYGRPSGTLPRAVLYTASAVAVLLVLATGFRVYSKVSEPPPAPQQKPALKPLEYQICGGFGIGPHGNKTHDFQLEFDPSNPNHQGLTLHIKHWYVQFDGFPGQAEGTDTMRLAANGKVIAGVTRQEAIGARVWFKPFKRLVGHVTGTYHYEMSYGPDEDSATTPIEINDDIAVDFGPEGLPIGRTPADAVKFTPTTGKNMDFDPTPCEVDPSVRV